MFLSHRRTALAVALVCVAVFSVSANDVAMFANLGFSSDSEVFMFGQYGLQESHAFADIYTVNVPRNTFVSDGVFSLASDMDLGPGQSGIGALYSLIPEATDVAKTYGINHLRQGRLIYLLVNGSEVRPELSFRDFETGNRYQVRLVQEKTEAETMTRAAFFVELEVEFSNGTRDSYRIGRPGYFRDNVAGYRIKQIVVSPDERSLIIVVEKIENVTDGSRIRYMVETVQIR